MKTTVSAAVGGYNFIFDKDAFERLRGYLDRFESGLEPACAHDVMEELELRVAELFRELLSGKEVVDIRIVDSVISQLGLPGGEQYSGEHSKSFAQEGAAKIEDLFRGSRRLFRDTDERKIGGVCSGLALYFGVDVVVIRLILILALLLGTAGFWVYVILWAIVPPARTASEKCELHGLEPTAENIRRFTSTSNK